MEIPKTEFRKEYLKDFDEIMRRPKYVEDDYPCDNMLKEYFPCYYEFVRIRKDCIIVMVRLLTQQMKKYMTEDTLKSNILKQ